MNGVLHKSETRGLADHGWLLSRHTFSFANYHNPERMNFGLLRVVNDDIVKPSMGFDTHPHKNMEIISIPLAGSLRHQDSMGNTYIIESGEIQVMSAGSGVMHSEYNNSDEEEVHFLQIWILPKERDIEPRYQQCRFDQSDRQNRFQLLVSPDASDKGLSINQEAWFSMADLEVGKELTYQKHNTSHGVYFFVIEGRVDIEGTSLERRDGLGLEHGESIKIKAKSNAQLLAIEVPIPRH
jgi:redox-sensitive bicupin YhaK (pirin superfamily)